MRENGSLMEVFSIAFRHLELTQGDQLESSDGMPPRIDRTVPESSPESLLDP